MDSDNVQGMVEALENEIQLFHEWAANHPKDYGEWETDYMEWGRIYEAVKQVFENVPIKMWDSNLQEQLLYIIARDNEDEEIVGWLVDYPDKFLSLARTALSYDDWNARWQVAHYLYKLEADDPEVEGLLRNFMKDGTEYVRRRACMALSYRQTERHLKEIAEVRRIGLFIGLFTQAEVIDWADWCISTMFEPPFEIIEVSMSGHQNVIDTAAKLQAIKGEYDQELVVNILLGLMYERLIHKDNYFDIRSLIYKLLGHYDLTSDAVTLNLWALIEEFDTVTENINCIEDMKAHFKEFLGRYSSYVELFQTVDESGFNKCLGS